MERMLTRQSTEVFGRWAGNRFGSLQVRETVASRRQSFGQHYEAGFLFRCFLDEPRKLTATIHRRLAPFWPIVNRGEPHFARKRGFGLRQRDLAPFRSGPRRPAK